MFLIKRKKVIIIRAAVVGYRKSRYVLVAAVYTVTAVRKANALLVHENRTAEARFLRASRVAIDNPSLTDLYVTPMTGTSYVRLSYVSLAIN